MGGNWNYERISVKKYLLLIEDEDVWRRFKESIDKDINTEIIELIKKKIEGGRRK